MAQIISRRNLIWEIWGLISRLSLRDFRFI